MANLADELVLMVRDDLRVRNSQAGPPPFDRSTTPKEIHMSRDMVNDLRWALVQKGLGHMFRYTHPKTFMGAAICVLPEAKMVPRCPSRLYGPQIDRLLGRENAAKHRQWLRGFFGEREEIRIVW